MDCSRARLNERDRIEKCVYNICMTMALKYQHLWYSERLWIGVPMGEGGGGGTRII